MIHPCDKSCGNKTASGYCATTTCINPLYSNIGTAQYVQGVQKRIITNADRIRAMSDDELRELLVTAQYGEHQPWEHAKCLLAWLKQEIKE